MHNRVQFAMLEQLNFISRQHLTGISNADYIFRDFYDYKLLPAVRSLQSNRLITGLFDKVFRDVGIRKIMSLNEVDQKGNSCSKYCHSTLPLGTIKTR